MEAAAISRNDGSSTFPPRFAAAFMNQIKTRHIVLGLLAGGGALWGLQEATDDSSGPTTQGSGGSHYISGGHGGGSFWGRGSTSSGISRGGFGGTGGHGGS
jgi:hypothetical protein